MARVRVIVRKYLTGGGNSSPIDQLSSTLQRGCMHLDQCMSPSYARETTIYPERCVLPVALT